jgi:hypothetical protein
MRRRLPTIVRQTRYFRGIDFREPFSRLPIDWLFDHAAHTRRRFLASGYAWVDVCARGSGASFGARPCPWSPDEVADGAEIVDWIVKQPWSSGAVGATGVSYDGTTADFLLVNAHPAVKAIAPRFSLFDVYADVAFPGGIQLAWFTEQWGRFNRELDDNRLDLAFARMLRIQLEALATPDRFGRQTLHFAGRKRPRGTAHVLALAAHRQRRAAGGFGHRWRASRPGGALASGKCRRTRGRPPRHPSRRRERVAHASGRLHRSVQPARALARPRLGSPCSASAAGWTAVIRARRSSAIAHRRGEQPLDLRPGITAECTTSAITAPTPAPRTIKTASSFASSIGTCAASKRPATMPCAASIGEER